ncbi:MAG: hypothetical protein Q8R10_12695 [Pseudomonas sp.]|uniref:hypothetical protein n=1 Tax=Pseudomonas sp. TaxID=306 RepID=UPI0027360FFE|nr:hypothetical protein [Pseudomonas sp.]MDP3847268.1 hypothetical protein [Pseudomonas sp.]
MSTYYVDFNNNTEMTWTMGVYQVLPDSIGLESVSWKQTTVPTQGSSGVEWEVDYNVAIANYKQVGGVGVYKASQTLVTELGSVWDCVFKDNVQQLVQSSGSAPADSIIINNKSNQLGNLGIGMSGQGAVFKKNVVSGASAQFQVTPTYYAGLFNDLVLGEVISSNVSVGPQKIVFPDGQNCATVTASMSGESIKMSVSYSQVSLVSRQVLDRLMSIQQERTGILLEHN